MPWQNYPGALGPTLAQPLLLLAKLQQPCMGSCMNYGLLMQLTQHLTHLTITCKHASISGPVAVTRNIHAATLKSQKLS